MARDSEICNLKYAITILICYLGMLDKLINVAMVINPVIFFFFFLYLTLLILVKVFKEVLKAKGVIARQKTKFASRQQY